MKNANNANFGSFERKTRIKDNLVLWNKKWGPIFQSQVISIAKWFHIIWHVKKESLSYETQAILNYEMCILLLLQASFVEI